MFWLRGFGGQVVLKPHLAARWGAEGLVRKLVRDLTGAAGRRARKGMGRWMGGSFVLSGEGGCIMGTWIGCDFQEWDTSALDASSSGARECMGPCLIPDTPSD